MKDVVSVSAAGEQPPEPPFGPPAQQQSLSGMVEVSTPSACHDFRASWVVLPRDVPGRLLAGPWPCDKGCTEGDKVRVMKMLLGRKVGVRLSGPCRCQRHQARSRVVEGREATVAGRRHCHVARPAELAGTFRSHAEQVRPFALASGRPPAATQLVR